MGRRRSGGVGSIAFCSDGGVRTRFTILGPHPGGETYSIVKYFNFYRLELSPVLGERIVGRCPGDIRELEGDRLPSIARLRAWRQNYLSWPVQLSLQRSDCFHVVDQGLMWYARFLRAG